MSLAPPESGALPLEVILFIYKLLQETNNNKNSATVDFLCCSMVNTSWNICAAPRIVGKLDSLNICAQSVEDLHRIAAVLEESRRWHPELGQQLRSLTVQVYSLFDTTSELYSRPVQCIGKNHHDRFVLKEDMAKAVADLLVRAFALEDLTFDFDGVACRLCLQNASPFFESIVAVSKRLKRLSFRNFRFDYMKNRTPDKQETRENDTEEQVNYAHNPIADFITQQSQLEEICFHLFDGDDLITRALSTCSNIRIAYFDNVDDFSPNLLSVEVLPRWPHLHTLIFDAPHVSLHRLVNALRVNCLQLEDLILPAHTHDNEELVVALHKLIRERSDQLKHLSVQYCSIADDSFLIFLCDSLPNIERLSISHGSKFTGKRIKAVEWRKLRYLDISGCIRILPAFIFAVLKNCPQLTEFRMSLTTWRESEVQCRLVDAGFQRRPFSIDDSNHDSVWEREVPNI